MIYIGHVTWPRGDMKLILSSPSDNVIVFLLYKILTIDNDICGDSANITEDLPKFVRRPDERFRTVSEDYRR